jgi:phage terminase large subunit-like protein
MIFNGQEVHAYYEKTFERHKRDLATVESGAKPNLRFNKKLGLAYIQIIESMKHYKGELAGQNIKLEAWQKKSICIAFGWERKSSRGKWVRRFNTVFFFIPRKNGKTLLASAITIADSIIRFEIGGEVVIFATKNKQAKLAWTGVEHMVKAHKELKEDCKITYGVITMQKTDTTFSTLGRDSDTEDGSNPSIGVADELHAHPDNSLYEVVESGQGSRIQPLMFGITTAGINMFSPGYNMYEYAKNILEERIEDDSFFAFIAEPDKEDDPFEESTWAKANPNYGVSVSKDYMERQAKQAYERPELKNNFLIKNLNVWTNSAESFIPYEKWKACAGEMIDTSLTGVELVQGFDLSIADDFSAKASIYKYENKFYVKMKHYIPKENLFEREKTLKVPLISWVSEGWITATPGSTIDYDFIYEDMVEHLDICKAVVYDPWKAKHLLKRLEDNGYEDNIPLRQGFGSISSPTKFFLDLVKEGNLVHENDPVLNWMVSNLTIVTDATGNIKPDKTNPNKKIDGPAAIINALSYFEATQDEKTINVYEERGMRSL